MFAKLFHMRFLPWSPISPLINCAVQWRTRCWLSSIKYLTGSTDLFSWWYKQMRWCLLQHNDFLLTILCLRHATGIDAREPQKVKWFWFVEPSLPLVNSLSNRVQFFDFSVRNCSYLFSRNNLLPQLAIKDWSRTVFLKWSWISCEQLIFPVLQPWARQLFVGVQMAYHSDKPWESPTNLAIGPTLFMSFWFFLQKTFTKGLWLKKNSHPRMGCRRRFAKNTTTNT